MSASPAHSGWSSARAARDRLRALWLSMKEQGSIAAGFWAFMTHRHIAPELRGQIFGESPHAVASHGRLGAAASQPRRLHSRRGSTTWYVGGNGRRRPIWRPSPNAMQQSSRLKGELADARQGQRGAEGACHADSTETPLRTCQDAEGAGDRQSAGAVRRGRAGDAQAEGEIREPTRHPDRAARPRGNTSAGSIRGPGAAWRADRALCGGHNRQMPHLQKIAETFGASLLHHDGGLEDAVTRIDDVLPSVDCVLCRSTASATMPAFAPSRAASGSARTSCRCAARVRPACAMHCSP
jgi:hypothetical protein